MSLQVTAIFNEGSEETAITIVETGERTKHWFRVDPDKELYSLALLYIEGNDEKEAGDEDIYESLLIALTPKENLVKTYTQLQDSDFITRKGRTYLKGTFVPVPEAIAAQIALHQKQGHPTKPIINFWILSLLNPNTDARDRMFEYCMTYGATLTPNGYVFMYKAVSTLETLEVDEKLVEYVNQVEGLLSGENVDQYEIYVSTIMNAYCLRNIFDAPAPDTKLVGTVTDLQEKIADKDGLKALYTDKHTHTMKIRLGEPQTKLRSECDPDINSECSYGLHVGSYKYVKTFGSWEQDTILGCLVNPANVVALPLYDNSKIRVCEYLPHVVMTRDEHTGAWVEIPSAYTDIDYHKYEQEALVDVLSSASIEGENVVVTQQVLDFYSGPLAQ